MCVGAERPRQAQAGDLATDVRNEATNEVRHIRKDLGYSNIPSGS